jgi:DNA mismatch repair protein MutL
MGRIRVLEETIANQIAAGEVIERPASVVKELVENSLDAGAARIEVDLEGGGADRIRVADDGSGMAREDAILAFERHATSKIRRAEDLRTITSFGFRGEALPSIASVARVTLTSSLGAPEGGTRVRVHGGSAAGIEPAPHPRGTTVLVEGLFFNAPARRRFLRSRATETAHVVEVVARTAAAHPATAFMVRSGDRQCASWSAAADYRERVAQMVGPEAGSMVPIAGDSGATRIAGLASAPLLSRSTAREQHLFVNGRPIRDRRILHAIQEAYATLLPRGRYPVAYLFLEVPLDEVDVNVHPAKTEVRFLRAAAVHDLVRESLLDGLGVVRPIYRPSAGAAPGLAERAPETPGERAVREGVRPTGPEKEPPPGSALPTPPPYARRLFEGPGVAPLAQYRDSYILASAPDGLIIVDQHAAHERILFDRLMSRDRAGRPARQRLLFPVTVEVAPAARQSFDEAAEALETLGFGVAPFGDGAIIVDEVPVPLGGSAVDTLMRDLLGEIIDWRRAEGLGVLRGRLAASAACHAAVTANHPLDGERMRGILTDLMLTESPMTCPHGRPAILRLTLDQIERQFRRR